MNNKKEERLLAYVCLLITICFSIVFFVKFLVNTSVGADNQRVFIEANLDKYINYEISDQDKGTLVEYNVRTGIEYGDGDYIPLKSSELAISLNQIDGKYPYAVKIITKSTELSNGKTENMEDNYEYDSNTGIIVIRASNQDENGEIINDTKPSDNARDEYVIIAYYDTYAEQEERELAIKVQSTVTLSTDDRQIRQENEFKGIVKDNIGELTSVTSEANEIYNGYIKSNIINGTNYDTEYKETAKIMVSKKEAGQKIEFKESNSFERVYQNSNGEEITEEFSNNGDLVYKSTKIKQQDMKRLLGENGVIEILDGSENLIATIDENTQFAEDGSIVINYENEPESIIIKTSNIENEGILAIENTKKIKSTMRNIDYTKIKTSNQIIGINEETVMNDEEETTEEKVVFTNSYENTTDIKESTNNINIDISNTEWTNKNQNEITFNVYISSNSTKDNMLKNPSVRIELPSEVEKVILGEASVVYANGLELQDPYLETSENGNIVIVANLIGTQTEYDGNTLELVTDVKISATIILKKDIENTTGNVNLTYTNYYAVNGKAEIEDRSSEIKIASYKEESIREANPLIATYANTSLLTSTTENIEGLTVEVTPVRGDTVLKDGDTVYEGEFIKYNIKVTNTSDKQIDNIKVVGSIPEGTTYGELEADYHAVYGTTESRYEYIFYEDTKIKEIQLGALEKGESVSAFYEVKVKDLLEEQTEQRTLTSIKVHLGDTEVASYELNNVIKPAEAKIFIKSFLGSIKHQWQYHVCVESDEKKDTIINLKVPKGFELYSVFDNEEKIDILEKTDISEDEQNIAINIQTNKEYILYYYIKPSQLEQKTKDSKVELVVTASVEMNENTYRSNENRILFEYESISISMTSPNEEEEVKYGAEINYEIKITSTGINNISDLGYSSIPINVTDFLPEEVRPVSIEYDKWEEVIIDKNEEEGYYTPTGEFTKSIVTEDIPTILKDSEGNKLPNVDLTLNIPYGETAIIKIKTTAGLVYDKTRIQNCVAVSSYNSEVDTELSNIVSHILLPFDYDETLDEPSDPDEPNEPIHPDNPGDNNEKYSISGVAWLDENEDGKKQTSEKLLNGITVMLVNTNNSSAIQAKQVTDSNGAYRFSGLEEGNYIVVFNYDTDVYSITEYQKRGVSSSLNSDAISKEITLMGVKTKVGLTDTISLNASLSNIDMGLIKNKICDLKLDKYISKVQVRTTSGTKEYTYDNNQLAKVEIKSKEIQGATVVVTYKIVVTNEGELPAYATKVVDYIPEGLDFSSDLNKSWTTTKNGELTNISIANRRIEAGESVELTLVLTKSMTSNSTGTFTNIAEIGEMTNSLGARDTDSIPGNKVENEDDYSKADLIISVSTGIVIYISLGIVLVLFISIILYLAYRYGTLKFRKVFLFGTVFVITIITTTTATLATTRREFHFDKFGNVTGYTRINSKGETVYTGFYAYNPGSTGSIKAECQEVDKPVLNTLEHYEWYVTDPSFNEYTYYHDEIISGSSTFKMSKVTNTEGIGINETQNGKLLLGPFMFNLTDSVTGKNKKPHFEYLITMNNGDKISGETAYDINGNRIEFKASTSLYFEIPNEQKEYGVKSLQITGNHEGVIEKEITYGGYLIYRADSVNYKDVQIIKTTDIIEEFEDIEVPINPNDHLEWTEFNGGLEIIKTDKETGKGLEEVTFNITGPSYPNGHTIETGADGKTKVMNNLLVGEYTITEISNPNYGYTIMVQEPIKVKSAQTVIYYANNEKQTGNLHIEKKDKYTEKPLEGISFKIKADVEIDATRVDINQDKDVDINDVTALQAYIAGSIRTSGNFRNDKVTPYGLGDLNNDGTIDNDDVILLQTYMSGTNPYVVVTDSSDEYKGKEVTGSISLTNMAITADSDEATIFTTDDKGEINVLNMLTGDYLLEETSVGQKEFGYDVDGKYISYEYTNDGGKTITSEEGKNNIPFTIIRQESTETGVNPYSQNITYSNVLNVYNRRKYIKLSGYAWEDMYYGKQSNRNNLYNSGELKDENGNSIADNNDKRLNEVRVTLYKEDGTKLDETTTKTITNTKGEKEDGAYIFGDYLRDTSAKKILIKDLEGAYIQFTYNGLNYETVALNCIDEEGKKVQNGNTAKEFTVTNDTEENEREKYNAKYEYVDNEGIYSKDGTCIGMEYDYDSENYSSTLHYNAGSKDGYEGAKYPIRTSYYTGEEFWKMLDITARTETNIDTDKDR